VKSLICARLRVRAISCESKRTRLDFVQRWVFLIHAAQGGAWSWISVRYFVVRWFLVLLRQEHELQLSFAVASFRSVLDFRLLLGRSVSHQQKRATSLFGART
jgi:hypothetical protein